MSGDPARAAEAKRARRRERNRRLLGAYAEMTFAQREAAYRREAEDRWPDRATDPRRWEHGRDGE